MRRWVSLLVMVLGLVHVVSEVMVNGSELLDLALGGPGGLPSAPDSQRAAFYSVLFGLLAAAAGQVMFWAASRLDALPVVPGIVLIAVGSCGAYLAPRAPFWAALALGVLVVIAGRWPAPSVRFRRRTSGAAAGPTRGEPRAG